MFSETLIDNMLIEAGLKFPNEEFFDALEDFRGPEPQALDYTPEQDAHYAAWKAKRRAKAKTKGETPEQRRARIKAKTIAFYTPENIANEKSPFEDD